VATVDPSFDARLRRAADRWLTVRTNDGSRPISWNELEEFEFDGEPFKLKDRQRGIRKPRELTAALSITTTYTPPGRPRRYSDEIGPDGLIRYKWRDDAQDADNRALREAVAQQVPLIWFVGIAPGVYEPLYPVFVVAEEPELQQFVIAPDEVRGIVVPGTPVDENVRRYVLRQTRQRLHQPVFRATVLHAYETRCAVCALRHAELLDAAHIVADSDEGGIASVRNGLALCKIHHAAYDVSVLGIRPDLVVEIRADLLAEIDGPMLEHGLKGRHGQPLMVRPRARADRPDPELLDQRYTRFRTAG
jgi:putative restriction endonuclease